MHALDDTIAALATAPGGAARAIVRISGPAAIDVLRGCFQPSAATPSIAIMPSAVADDLFRDRRIISGHSSDSLRLPIDAYVWPDQRSYTRQPMVELHTIGSPPLVEHLLRQVCTLGARLAQPGEFTPRAFLAGRLDLTQAEAVLGVIDAQDRRQLGGALAQLAGGLSRPLDALRSELLDLLADLEAGLDFVDEGIEFVTAAQLIERLTAVQHALDEVSSQLHTRGETTVAARVVLYGWPNTGKSSLFNALIGQQAAIVSSQSGTTRDYLVEKLSGQGTPIELIDTAGVELGFDIDGIAAAAQDSSTAMQQQAVLRVLCLDSTRPLNDWERTTLAATHTPLATQPLVILTKCDQPRILPVDCLNGGTVAHTSAATGAGLPELLAAIESRISTGRGESGWLAATAARCSDSLHSAGAAVGRALLLAKPAGGNERPHAELMGAELISAELRVALQELGRVVGAVYTNDLLDRIFSRFCIGK